MPYRRRARKTYRKRRVARSGLQERKIRKVVKAELKKEIESKFFDSSVNSTLSTTASAIPPLSGFSRGTGVSNFIGMKVKPIYLTIRGTLQGSDNTNYVRILVIQDKAVSGTPNTSTIFQNTSYPWLSPLNVDYIDSYTVLADRLYSFRTFESAAGTFTGTVRPFKIKISGKKMRQITYTAAGSADSGQLWIIAVSDSALPSHPGYVMLTRFTYTDA